MTDPLRDIGAAFDARAPQYDESAMHRSVATAVAGFVDLDGVSRVLDIATGTGLVLRALARRTKGLTLTGVDISPGMLDIARAELPDAAWIDAEAASIPIDDATIDLATCVTALHIIPSVARAAGEWSRVLRPGGRLVTATFAGAVPGGATAQRGGTPVSYPRDHTPYADPDALATSFQPAGFQLRRHTSWSDGVDTVLIAELERTPRR
ncbi:class I SAM-dependent methyltransferase [Microbacterium sp. MYb62]|uniref:class I SAM-dependent methyltransferase n=1 Tax=Microbacterium sp. MYb62 TaxID=1848690 RepID=UPI000CFDBDDF|nr:methyltransferase domain-containing protein [Microbacterium sp. MYb62]PRB12203.1 methyltransferase type 11 [Microbacterium sp. MYb62]